MPSVPFQSYLRLTHSGSTLSSVLIPDLDVGYENQQRKSPVYVPVGGFIDVPLTTRVLFSAMQGTIAAFANRGLIFVSASSYARDVDNLGGAGGTGITLNALVATNVRRLGNTLSFVINSGLDTSGFIAGERMTVTGLSGAFDRLDGTYLITAFTKGQDFVGANPLASIVSVQSIGVAIPAALLVGVTLTLPDGMTTHLYVSAGNAGGLGADVRSYFAGDMVLTGNLDPQKILFSPIDMLGAESNSLGVDVNTGLLTFINSSGVPVPLDGTVPPLAEQVIVAKSGATYTSVATAIASILDAAADKPYLVTVGPGVFEEPPFTIPSYVTIVGSGPYATILQATNTLAHFINGSPFAEIDNVSIDGPSGVGFACINYEGTGTNAFKVFNVELASGYYGIWAHPASSGIILCDEVFNYSQGLMHTFMYASGRAILRGVICSYRDDAAKGNTYGFRAEGANVQMYLDNCIYKDANGTYGAYINGGGTMRLTNYNCAAATNALYVGPTGASQLNSISTVLRPVVTNHVVVTSTTAQVLFSGVASQSKISIATGAGFVANFSDPAGGTTEGQVNIGELYLAYPNGNETPVRDYLGFTSSTGLADGGEVTRNVAGGLKLDVAEGEGFISLDPEQGMEEVYWSNTTLDMTDDSNAWIIINSSGQVVESLSQPSARTSIILAEVITQGGQVVFLGQGVTTNLYQSIPRMQTYRYLSNGPRCASGIATTANVVPLKLDIDGGAFYIGDNYETMGSGSAVTFTAWYRGAAPTFTWTAVPGQTLIDDEQYNDLVGGGLAPIPGGEYAGHVTYVAATADGPEYHVVYGTMTDPVIANVTAPTPPDWLLYTAARSGQVIVLKSAGVIAQVNDARQFGSSSPAVSGGGGVTAHGLLTGLANDDHTQYQLRSEKGGVSGYCGLDAGQKVAAINIPFTATAASNVTDGLPSAGAGTEVARQNHVHFHGNLDSVDGSVVALHGNAVAGVKPGFISAADQTKLDGLAILHASRHAIGGTDVLTPGAIGAWTKAESDTRDTLRQGGLREEPTWDDNGDGTITVHALTAVLFANADFSGHPEQYTIPEVTHTPADETKTYIVVDYNGGSPIQKAITDVMLITESTVIPVITLWRSGNDLSLIAWDTTGRGLANKLHQRFVKTSRFARESGLVLSEEAGRKIHVGVGRTWYGAVPVDSTDFISGTLGQDTVFFSHVAGVWTQSSITQYNNSQYDNGTDLQPLSADRYAVNWVYRGLCENHDRIAVLLGNGDFTAAEASASQPPAPPPCVTALTILVGRIIVKNGDPTATQIDSAFDVVFAGSIYPDHNDLTGLNAGDYKHLTATEYTDLTDGGATTLHSHAHGNQAGGTLHAVATTSVAGFMAAADKTKLDGIPSNATAPTASAPVNVTKSAAIVGVATDAARADHKHDITTAAPSTISTSNTEGTSTSLARADHIHAHGDQIGETLHALASAGVTAGFMSGADKSKLDGLITNAVPQTRNLTAGNGLTGGGDLSADRTFAVSPNVDGSIAVGAGGVQVGVLASDAQHGTRGGGTQHSAATAGTAGFMSAADKSKLDGVAAGAAALTAATPANVTKATADVGVATTAARADHKHDVTTAAPSTIGTSNLEGTSTSLARADHIHNHGNQAGGTLHSDVIAAGASGFMSGTDKTKLDGISSNAAALTASTPADVDKSAAVVGIATTAARSDHKHNISTAGPSSVGTANAEGSSASLARADHIHNHGTQTDGTLHAAAVAGGASGFMTGSDKTKLDGIPASVNGTVFAQTTSVTVVNTAVETVLNGTGSGSVTLPTNFLTVGKTIRIRAGGTYTRANGTITIRVRIGGVAGTIIVNTAAITPTATGTWRAECDFTCRSTGSGGTVIGHGYVFYFGATGGPTFTFTSAGVVSVDTTLTRDVALTAQHSSGAAGNSITCTNLTIESL